MFSARKSKQEILYGLLTATHSITSTCLGNITMVLKFPLTKAASTNGLHKYKGFCTGATGEGGAGGGFWPSDGNVEEVGVGDRFGPLGARLLFLLRVRVM